MARETIIEAAFPYDASVVVDRKRNADAMQFTATAPVRIRHAERADMKDAAVLRNTVTRLRQPAWPGKITLRGYEGRLWAPFLRADTGHVLSTEMLRRISAVPATAPPYRFGNPFSMHCENIRTETPVDRVFLRRRLGDIPGMESVNVRKIEGSDLERRTIDAQRIADSLLIVDGGIWFRCFDPHWSLSAGRRDLVLGIANDGADVFRVDRIDEMEAYAASLPHAASNFEGEAEILDGGMFTRSDTPHVAERLYEQVSSAFRHLFPAPPPVLSAWSEMREAAWSLKQEWSGEKFVGVLDRMAPVQDFLKGISVGSEADLSEIGQITAYNEWLMRRCAATEGWSPLAAADEDALSAAASFR